MNSTLDAGHPEFLIQIGRDYSRKKYRKGKLKLSGWTPFYAATGTLATVNLKKCRKRHVSFPDPGE
jgi:hypothetical protein